MYVGNKYVRDIVGGSNNIKAVYLGNKLIWKTGYYWATYTATNAPIYAFTNCGTSSSGTVVTNSGGTIKFNSSFPCYSPTKIGNYYFIQIKWDTKSGLKCINASTGATTYIFPNETEDLGGEMEKITLAGWNGNAFVKIEEIDANHCGVLKINQHYTHYNFVIASSYSKILISQQSLSSVPNTSCILALYSPGAYYNKYDNMYYRIVNNLNIWNNGVTSINQNNIPSGKVYVYAVSDSNTLTQIAYDYFTYITNYGNSILKYEEQWWNI